MSDLMWKPLPRITDQKIALEYTEALIKDAVFAYWKRSIGLGLVVALSLSTIGLAGLLATGDRSWFVGALGVCIVAGAGFGALLYVTHLRNSMAQYRALGNDGSILSVGVDTLSMESTTGMSTVKWARVIEIWKFEYFWLLLFSKAQFFILPLHAVPTDMQLVISEKVRKAGGNVDTDT